LKTDFKRSFIRDLRKLKDKRLRERLADAIKQVEQAKTLLGVKSLEKLKGDGSYFRIRIGDFRVGLRLDNDTIVFIRFLHRKEIYRYFP